VYPVFGLAQRDHVLGIDLLATERLHAQFVSRLGSLLHALAGAASRTSAATSTDTPSV
jgi:hypothetical protein